MDITIEIKSRWRRVWYLFRAIIQVIFKNEQMIMRVDPTKTLSIQDFDRITKQAQVDKEKRRTLN